MPPPEAEDGEDDGAAGALVGGAAGVLSELPQLPDRSKYPDLAVLPTVIQSLVRRRQAVKKLLKTERNPVAQQALDIRQKALKILANSMYGCLGFAQSRFYARPLAALVTAQGREILQRTCELAQVRVGWEAAEHVASLRTFCWYCRTRRASRSCTATQTRSSSRPTSLTTRRRARRVRASADGAVQERRERRHRPLCPAGEDVKRAVNKLYRHLEIEIDNVFASLLLLKASCQGGP